MNPSSSLATLRPDLGGAFMEFDMEMAQQGFIGHEVLPSFEVNTASGTFGKVPIEQLLQSMPTERAPGSAYNRAKWTFTSDSFITQEYGHEEAIDDNEANIYANYLDIEMISAERARRIVMEAEERRIAALIQDAGTYNTVGITDEWDDATSAIPITDVNAAVDRLWAKGIIANALILTRKQFRALRVADQVVEKIASFGSGSPIKARDIGLDAMKAVFDLDYIFVAGGIKNTAAAGLAGSFTGIWSDEWAGVTRVPTSGDLREPCFGRTFHFGLDGSSVGGAMETYRDETVRGNVVRCRHQVQAKVLYPEAMELLSNAITI